MQIERTLAAAANTTGTAQAPKKAEDKEKVLDAAKQFESLLVAQLLKSMRSAGSGSWMGTGDDSASACAIEYAEEAFAQSLCAGGGLGLARMVADGLGSAAAPKTADPLSSETFVESRPR